MKKKFRAKLVGACFLALFTMFATFSVPAFADSEQDTSSTAKTTTQAPPTIDPAVLAALLLILFAI